MTRPTLATVLAMSSADAYAAGLLVPVSATRQRTHHLPFPTRLTALAWSTYIAPTGRRRRDSTPADLDRRLDRLLEAIHQGLQHVDLAAYDGPAMTLSMATILPDETMSAEYPGVSVLFQPDDQGQDALTVMLASEWDALRALREVH